MEYYVFTLPDAMAHDPRPKAEMLVEKIESKLPTTEKLILFIT